jgi:hypothetical protein
MRPTAYQLWLYNISEGNANTLKHFIKQGLIEGNQATFDLCEEADVVDIDELSLSDVTYYLIKKIERNEDKI